MNYIFLPISCIVLTVYSQLILRMRVSKMGDLLSFQNLSFKSLFVLMTDFWILSALGTFFLSFICWSLTLSGNFNITKVYPIVSSLIIFFVSLANFILFQDKLELASIFGGIFILLGVFLLLK